MCIHLNVYMHTQVSGQCLYCMSESVRPWDGMYLCECMIANGMCETLCPCPAVWGCRFQAELMTQPACWQLWQCPHPSGWRLGGGWCVWVWGGGQEGRAVERTDLGHDRSSRGRRRGCLRWLRRLGGSMSGGLGGHNHGGLLWSRHSHGHGGLLEEQRRDREINRTWRLPCSKATENSRQEPQRSCHIWCPDFSEHRLTDKEEEGEVVKSWRLRKTGGHQSFS